MIIELVIKITSVGIISAILSLILYDSRKEYAIILRIASVILILLNIITLLKDKFDDIYALTSDAGDHSSLITLMLKGVIIITVTSIGADICRESGSASVGKTIQFAGRVIIVIITYPMLESVIKTAMSFVGG